MDEKQEKLFRTIFSDAILIDLDFSVWDKYISILLIADHLSSSFSKVRRPVFKVNFVKAENINIKFRHHESYIYENDPMKHYTWALDRFTINQSDDNKYSITLSQLGVQPILEVTCRNIDIREIDPKILDTITPNWFKPYTPFARRDIESIYAFVK